MTSSSGKFNVVPKCNTMVSRSRFARFSPLKGALTGLATSNFFYSSVFAASIICNSLSANFPFLDFMITS